jgi:hypothetical protein
MITLVIIENKNNKLQRISEAYLLNKKIKKAYVNCSNID